MSGKKWGGLASFVLVLLIATWLVGPIALWTAWAIAVVVLAVAVFRVQGLRARWILISTVALLVIVPAAVIVELSGTTTVHVFG